MCRGRNVSAHPSGQAHLIAVKGSGGRGADAMLTRVGNTADNRYYGVEIYTPKGQILFEGLEDATDSQSRSYAANSIISSGQGAKTFYH